MTETAGEITGVDTLGIGRRADFNARAEWRREIAVLKAEMGVVRVRDLHFSGIREFCNRLAETIGWRREKIDARRGINRQDVNVVSFDQQNRNAG